LPLNDARSHNRKIVTFNDSYDENGGLALLLDKCPNLETLTAPSAPSSAFFEREKHGLKALHLQAGFDHQGFISLLGQSTCFPTLTEFSFRDYAETYMENYEKLCTPYAAYEQLMTTTGLPSLKHIVLYDTVLNAQQQDALVKLADKHGKKVEFKTL
jgi:hypothetical protein